MYAGEFMVVLSYLGLFVCLCDVIMAELMRDSFDDLP